VVEFISKTVRDKGNTTRSSQPYRFKGKNTSKLEEKSNLFHLQNMATFN
jgi:hypothetical protein